MYLETLLLESSRENALFLGFSSFVGFVGRGFGLAYEKTDGSSIQYIESFGFEWLWRTPLFLEFTRAF